MPRVLKQLVDGAFRSATDIAFALGVLSLLGSRVPNGVRVFLSTLAVADDIIAIIVIAVFYGHSPEVGWLIAAGVVFCFSFMDEPPPRVFAYSLHCCWGCALVLHLYVGCSFNNCGSSSCFYHSHWLSR